MTYQFQTIIQGETNPPKRHSFMEAWNDMYLWVKGKLNAGNLSYAALETCIWIEMESEEKQKSPILFNDARDRAIQTYGWKKPN